VASIATLARATATSVRTGLPKRVAAGATPRTSFPALPRQGPKPVLMAMPGYAAAPIGAGLAPVESVVVGIGRTSTGATLSVLKSVPVAPTREVISTITKYTAFRSATQGVGFTILGRNVYEWMNAKLWRSAPRPKVEGPANFPNWPGFPAKP